MNYSNIWQTADCKVAAPAKSINVTMDDLQLLIQQRFCGMHFLQTGLQTDRCSARGISALAMLAAAAAARTSYTSASMKAHHMLMTKKTVKHSGPASQPSHETACGRVSTPAPTTAVMMWPVAAPQEPAGAKGS